jgi:glycerol-1-phosphate dehydrogenase [NAD(P)+]
MEGRVKAAFDWLDNDHSAANECWADYRIKLARWHAHKDELKDFLAQFRRVQGPGLRLGQKAGIHRRLHARGAPPRGTASSIIPVDAKTVRWAINNCCLMRNRFSVIDLLYFSGIWDAKFVDMLLDRADKLDAGL